MENQEMINEFEEFLKEDHKNATYVVLNNKGASVLLFDIKNEKQDDGKLWIPANDLSQIKEVFKYFCDKHQCQHPDSDYENDFKVYLSQSAMMHDENAQLYLSIFYDRSGF